MTNQREHQGKRRVKRAGLAYVQSLQNGWFRRRCGRGFTFHAANGTKLTGERTLKRIKSLVIPPAWDEVRICPDHRGHIQVVGRDEAGRLQYLYHPEWVLLSSETKFDRLGLIGSLLPKIRRRLRRDLSKPELSKDKVVAAVIRLIDKAHIRVGNSRYTEDNGSHGATTLTKEHVEVEDLKISLDYPGKSGQKRQLTITDALVGEVIRECEELGGQYLFSVVDNDAQFHPIGSGDVNNYLRDVAGEVVTAKDFRTWWGSVLALKYLGSAMADGEEVPAKKLLANAIDKTAADLGHTKAVCRSSYIHPSLISTFESGTLAKLIHKVSQADVPQVSDLTKEESLFLAILPMLNKPS